MTAHTMSNCGIACGHRPPLQLWEPSCLVVPYGQLDRPNKPTRKALHSFRCSNHRTVLEATRHSRRSARPLESPSIWTATAANYGEARSAESRADFIHKLKIVSKKLNATTIWLELIAESSLISPENLVAIVAENRELCRIIAASIKTVRARGG